MDKLTLQLKTALVRSFLNCKMDKLDESYIHTSKGNFTRREMSNEIENETEIGLQQMESILKLTIHLLEHKKETI
jgi:hypothetical protein